MAFVLPWLVFGICVLITYSLQNIAQRENYKNVQERFDFRANEIVFNIEARLRSYQQILRGAKGLFLSSEHVDRNEFREYVSQLNLAERYPGIQGLGFTLLIKPADLDAHVKQIQSEGFASYHVNPAGVRNVYTSILYLEPFDWRNQRAFGFDMFSEPVRHEAMQRALDENQTITSGKVTLIQETEKNKQPGFLVYLPVYRHGLPNTTLLERRENLLGWVYAPFRMHDLMSGIWGEHFGEVGSTIAFDIYDGNKVSPESLMYDFNAQNGISRRNHSPTFHATKHVDIGGHEWTLEIRSLPSLEAGLDSKVVRYIPVIGVTVSILASLIVWLLLTGRERAQAQANEITHELRASENHTKRLNRALKLLSDCNMTLVRADDENKFLVDICQLIVNKGGYLLAWVGYAEHDEFKNVRPVAQAGFEAGYLESLKVSWGDNEYGHGPTGTAVRTGLSDINQDYLNNPRMAPWKEAALNRGYRSSISLPLRNSSGIFGSLTIYAAEPRAFTDDEVHLLEELARDVAYGVETLRTRAEQRKAEEKLAFQAYHDTLTQLPNRLFLHERFDKLMFISQQERKKLAVMLLGLDNFKHVNDSLGHNLGDKLLINVAGKLNAGIRQNEIVGRLGGDQFVILITGLQEQDAIAERAQMIINQFAKPFEVEGNIINTTFSIGISVYPDDGDKFDTLLKEADTAMFYVKDSGRNNYQFFTQRMNTDALAQMQLLGQLHDALAANEFVLHYQAQVNLARGRISGFEALLRWQHPERGMVPPAEFISLAEKSGLIIPIGEWVINEACRRAKTWMDSGNPLVIAVNLSSVQFKRGNMLETVARALKNSGLPAHLLELELTESILLQDVDGVMVTLQQLKKMGVKLSIDDFGTGYSSLSYLKRLAVDKIKVDQSFVRDLSVDPEDVAIVDAIIQLGHILQLNVIAEGVETAEQLAVLKQYNCDEVQGYYLSRPIPADQVMPLFNKDFL